MLQNSKLYGFLRALNQSIGCGFARFVAYILAGRFLLQRLLHLCRCWPCLQFSGDGIEVSRQAGGQVCHLALLASAFRNQHLAAQSFGGSLAQHLPCSGGIALADGREGCPEIITAAIGRLHVGSWHFHLRTLVGRSRGSEATLVRGNLSSQAILGQLGGVGTFGTEELVDVLSEDLGIGQQGVIRGIVLSGSLDHGVRVLQLTLDGLDLLQSLSGLLGLGEESVLDDAGVAIQQGRGFSAEVLENFKTFAADALQILVARGCALLAAVARRLCRHRLGIGRRLWEC